MRVVCDRHADTTRILYAQVVWARCIVRGSGGRNRRVTTTREKRFFFFPINYCSALPPANTPPHWRVPIRRRISVPQQPSYYENVFISVKSHRDERTINIRLGPSKLRRSPRGLDNNFNADAVRWGKGGDSFTKPCVSSDTTKIKSSRIQNNAVNIIFFREIHWPLYFVAGAYV